MVEHDWSDYQARLTAGLCPHPDCGRLIGAGRLGCPHHWSLWPIALRRSITRVASLARFPTWLRAGRRRFVPLGRSGEPGLNRVREAEKAGPE